MQYGFSALQIIFVFFGYSDDIDKVRDIISAILDSDERILNDPPPQIAVSELADS
jgi:small conductance mechanosensitive channel